MNNQLPAFFENKSKVYATLMLIPFCLYAKSLFYNFSPMDDQWMILKNFDILADWKNIFIFFTKPLMGLYYRPLFSISLMFDFQLGKTSPFIYHFSNLLYHLISVILIYKLLSSLKVSNSTSFLLTLIFSVHPLLLHAVTWIPGRNDILLTIFSISSTLYLIKYLSDSRIKYLVFHFLFFFCSMLTKENAFVLPLFFAVLVYYFNKQKKTYLILFIGWGIILFGWYILRSLAVKSSLTFGTDFLESIKHFNMGLLLYIGKSLIPIHQSVFPTLKNSTIITGIISLILLVIIFFKLGLKNKALGISGLILFFSMISIPVWYGATGSSGEHYEHRIYLPLVGLLIFISQINFNLKSALFIYTMYFIAFVFSIKTFLRMNIYKNESSFIEAGLKEAPEYYFFYAVKGDELLAQQNYIASIPYYNSAIKLQPHRPHLYSSRGFVYNEIGRKEEAISDFTKAIEFAKNNPDMYLNRCLAYKKFGDYENATKDLTFLKKNFPQTIPEGLEQELFQQLYNFLEEKINSEIIRNPKNASLYVRRAKIFLSKNKSTEALQDIKHACELESNNSTFKTYLNQLSSRMK